MGNVSQLVPSIHPMIELLKDGILHTRDFANAADVAQGKAEDTILDGASVLASTVLRALAHPEILAQAQAEFNQPQR